MKYYEITEKDFVSKFKRMGRGSQFSPKARRALYQYLAELHGSQEVDIVGLCCTFAEYPSLRAAERDGVRDPANHIIAQGKGFVIVEIT